MGGGRKKRVYRRFEQVRLDCMVKIPPTASATRTLIRKYDRNSQLPPNGSEINWNYLMGRLHWRFFCCDFSCDFSCDFKRDSFAARVNHW